MTRVLQALLGAQQPAFQINLNSLERAGGLPGVDIRLTVDIVQRTRQKIKELGLDPTDTTPEELYYALKERLTVDDRAVHAALGLPRNSTNQEVIEAVTNYIGSITTDKAFVLKGASAKQLLTKADLTKTMKLLGYRSQASMLKHEKPAYIFAGAHIAESKEWWQKFRSNYESLTPSDFEMKRIEISVPSHARWQSIGNEFSADTLHNIVAMQELGSIVYLPISNSQNITGLSLVLLLLGIQSVNDIRCSSSYLKFQQVRQHFGQTVAEVSDSRVYAAATLAQQPVAWQALHRYYARNLDAYPAHIFEPHLSAEDLSWHQPEDVLRELTETLDFWEDTQSCALTDEAGTVVSMNIFDAVLNYCNNAPFASRFSEYIKHNVWHELTSRYLQQATAQKIVTDQLAGDTPQIA